MIQVLRETLIKQLASVKEDNVSIAGIAINRAKLLQALKLQTQPDAEVLTINYGQVSWQDGEHEAIHWHKPEEGMRYIEHNLEPEPCIQISCNHTTMRFLNKPKPTHKNGNFSNPPIPLNFVDHTEYTKPELTGIPLDTQELINALTYVLPCVAIETSRPVLNCVLFDSGDDIIKLVAADGFRLGIATIPAKGIPKDKVLIDPKELYAFLKSIKPIGRGKGKYFPDVYVAYDYKTVKFAYESGAIEFDKKEWAYPDYTQLIPKDGTRVQFIASQMLEVVKAISGFAKGGSGIIRLQFHTGEPCGKVILSCRSEEIGDTTAECDAKVEADCKIAVNTKYLLDLFRVCGDNMVDMTLTTPSSPMVFNTANRQTTVMPMFVQW